MNTTPYLHLCWKEYRTLRWFWLAIVVLALLMEITLAALVTGEHSQLLLVYNVALGVPAFFAVGYAGTVFAGEQEEGTVDFLRAAPISALHVFVSKLAITLLATLAMYAVLWLLSSQVVHRGIMPNAPYMPDIMALWCVAAFEALAWEHFFHCC